MPPLQKRESPILDSFVSLIPAPLLTSITTAFTSFIFPISDSSSQLWWSPDLLVSSPSSKMPEPELDFKSEESIKTCVLNHLPALPLWRKGWFQQTWVPLPVLSTKDFLRASTAMLYLYPVLSHCQLDNHVQDIKSTNFYWSHSCLSLYLHMGHSCQE